MGYRRWLTRTFHRGRRPLAWCADAEPTMNYAVINPATGETVKTYDTITDGDLEAAISAADEARRGWSKSTTVAERAALIRRVAELHTERRKELAEIIVREMGKPIGRRSARSTSPPTSTQYYADNAAEILEDEPIELLAGEGTAVIRRSSLGVLLGIMPWNFPYYQVARFAGPNLVIGNTILLKHARSARSRPPRSSRSSSTPASRQAPTSTSTRRNDQIETVIADPRVQGVSLTGSERAGAAVAEIAGRHLKKVVLELGGSDPFILLGTDDLDAAVEDAVEARLDNSGQSCNAAKRFIVVDELYEPFLEKFTAKLAEIEPGDPTSDDTRSARSPRSRPPKASMTQVNRAVEQGATAGRRRGPRRRLLPDDRADRRHARQSDAYHEEFFGPVAQVYRAKDEDDAVRIANDTPFGLGSYVYTHRPGAGAPRRRQHRGRHGVRQRRPRRRRGTALRRRSSARARAASSAGSGLTSS